MNQEATIVSNNDQTINKVEGLNDPARVSESTINQQEVEIDKLLIPRGKRMTPGKKRNIQIVEPLTNPTHSEEPEEASPLEGQSSKQILEE
jgi:hypothetical protein